MTRIVLVLIAVGVLCTVVMVLLMLGSDLAARRAKRRDPVEQHYADTVGIALSPEAAEQARLRTLAAADGAEAAFVSPGHRVADAFLAELFGPRTKDAPKEQP